MPRTRKPEAAAKAILDHIAKDPALNAEDVVKRHPELQPGLAFLQSAVDGTTRASVGSSSAAPSRPTARATGSGPMRLER